MASLAAVSYEIILVLLVIGISVLAIFGYQRTYSRKGLWGSILFLMFVVGAGRVLYADLSNGTLVEFADRYTADKPAEMIFRGYVSGEGNISSQTIQFDLKVKEIVLPDRVLFLDEKTRVTARMAVPYQIGDKVEIKGAVSRPHNFQEDFDYAKYLERSGIRTVILFPEISKTDNLKISVLDKLALGFKRAAASVRNYFERSVSSAMPEPNASFVNGILLGSRQNIPADLREDFNKTGTSHMLAISGYNIMIIGDSLLAFLVFFVRRRNAFWVSVAAISGFTIMTGASASVVRAAIMGLLLLFAQGYGRIYDARNSIVFAGALMVFLDPSVLVFDIGFQLSFLAVLGLLYLYPFLKNKFKKVNSMFGMKDAFLTTISAQAFVGIPVILYFGRFSWTFLPANILVLPFVPFAMLAGFVAGVGQMILPATGYIVAIPAWTITTYQIWIIKLLS